MIYTPLAREVWNRLTFHQTKVLEGEEKPLLDGLKLVRSGVFRVDAQKDLPQVTLVDLTGRETPGRTDGRLTIFLKTERKKDWFTLGDSTPAGLIEWMELVMDAVELSPSTGEADPRFCLHREDGTPIKDASGTQIQLLAEPFTWDFRVSEITELSFLMELDIVFVIPKGRRANRRTSPVLPSAYQAQ